MRHAFLILAAHAPNVLEQLIRTMAGANIEFFVHVDKKARLDEYLHINASNVHFIEERHEVFWGGFSMILAEIALLRAAVSYSNFETFSLLSDDSYVAKSQFDLIAALDKRVNRITTIVTSNFRWRYDRYFFVDSFATSPRHVPPAQRFFSEETAAAVADLERFMRIGKKPLNVMYQGSQWWSLTRDAIDVILESFENDTHLKLSFTYSCVPDEHYFQTIIGSNEVAIPRIGTPMYTDFSRTPAPFVFSSATDLEAAIQSECLFVRKISNDVGAIKCISALFDNADTKSH